MKKLNLLLSTLLLAALTVSCARGDKGDTGLEGPQGPTIVAPPPVAPDAIQILASEYNATRVAKGQDPVAAGLACSLYTVPNTTTQISGATLTSIGSWTYLGTFNDANGSSAPGLSVMPDTLRPVFTSYYVLKCTGLFAVASSGFYSFELSSDDGALLSVNGSLINNDGAHAVTTKTAVKYLDRGMVSFELDYFDIGGSHALILNSGGVLVNAEHFFH
jgi:PA14 domain